MEIFLISLVVIINLVLGIINFIQYCQIDSLEREMYVVNQRLGKVEIKVFCIQKDINIV